VVSYQKDFSLNEGLVLKLLPKYQNVTGLKRLWWFDVDNNRLEFSDVNKCDYALHLASQKHISCHK
jgi:hypothetical protein